MKRLVGISISFVMLVWLFGGCGSKKPQMAKGEDKSEPVTLKIIHYQNEAQKPFMRIFDDFMRDNPDIKIEYDLTGGDQYETLLRSRFSAREDLDIVGVHPGETDAITYVRGGYLEDLTGSSFLKGIDEKFLETGKYKGKYYGLPIDSSYIVCLYNTKIFDDMGLHIPTTWTQFLEVCKALDEASIIPLSLGIKDLWITQMIAYSLASTTIYRDNPDFDKSMYNGSTKFDGPQWKTTLEKYKALQPYFNHNFIHTSYEQQLSLFAGEQAAMMIMGTWTLPLIEEENPDLAYSGFVLPASDSGENWICFSVGGMLAISASSSKKAEARRFMEYFMSDKVYYKYVSMSCNIPIKNSIKVDYHFALSRLQKEVKGSYGFVNQSWPAGFHDYFMRGIQDMFAGKPIADILKGYDMEWAKRVLK